jgi:hypothetical protein
MCYWVLLKSGVPIARSTVQEIPKELYTTEDFKEELKTLDTALTAKFGDPVNPNEETDDHGYDINAQILDTETPQYEPWKPEAQMPEADEWEPDAYDQYISAQVILPTQDGQALGTVTVRKKDLHGNPIGISNKNPILDTRVYEVTFPDGHSTEFSANTIAKCLYSQVDPEGHNYALFDKVVDWRRDDDAVADHEFLQISHNGNIHQCRTTKGYKLCVKWKDGSTSWESLEDLKESYPVQVADFSVSQKIDDLPGFRWWVPQVRKRRDSIISAVKTIDLRRKHTNMESRSPRTLMGRIR